MNSPGYNLLARSGLPQNQDRASEGATSSMASITSFKPVSAPMIESEIMPAQP